MTAFGAGRSSIKALALLSAIVLFGFGARAEPFDPLHPAYHGDAIPFDHLSNEDTDPYLRYRRKSRREDLARAVAKYPDVRDCLVQEESVSEHPDLRRINWYEMQSRETISVCMFRIFSSLGTPERATQWFVAQGLEVKGPFETSSKAELWVGINAGQSPQESGIQYVTPRPRIPTLTTRLIGKFFTELVFRESFSAYWSKETGELLVASYSAIVK